jgi:subtilisin family serine protease
VLTVNMARVEQVGEVYYRAGSLVEFSARGVDVDVPWCGGATKKVTGSSFAAPQVAAMLACLLSEVPQITPVQAKALFQRLAHQWTPEITAPNDP